MKRVESIGPGPFGFVVDFDEDAVRARGHSRPGDEGYEFPLPARGRTLGSGLLDAMRGVDRDRDAERPHDRDGAEIDDEIVGQTMITFEWSDWRNGVFWWIQSVYVDQRFRGQGVFRALHDHIRTLAQANPQVRGLRLYVEQNNHPAIVRMIAEQALEQRGLTTRLAIAEQRRPTEVFQY